MVGARDVGDEPHAGVALLFGGELLADLSGLDVGANAAEVVEELVHGELGLEIVDEAGAIEGVDGEVGGGETALGKESAEGEDRIIGRLERLGVVDLRLIPGSRLHGAAGGGAGLRFGRFDGRVTGEGLVDGLAEGEGGLGGRGQGEEDER